ncbi:MFS transporter [Psychrobium sp. MM17-31]|uniref:MFS transporter n=1 Tax=Psychrobium sp. MM17-31 TaxID=2917758 RepID=UPI001EF7151E|nr:MFS transporter [Psychrobium sp. MM17-31]MCG7530818.1 MFS transporter [Psychrobium sp. MM17-31]
MSAIKSRDLSFGLSGMLTTCVGYTLILFMPLYLEFVGGHLSLNESQIGWLASTDAGGLALAALLFALLVKRLNFRYVVAAGCAIALIGNLLSIPINDFKLLCFIRIVTGFGEGLVVAAGITVIGMVSNPNRWFGIYTAAVVVVQGLGLIVLPGINDGFGVSGLFIFLAALFVLPFLVVSQLPSKANTELAESQVNDNDSSLSRLLLLALAGQLVFYAGIGGIWAYISLMGSEQGLAIDVVSRSLAIAMAVGALGGLAFAALGKRGDSRGLFALSIFIMMACAVGFYQFTAMSYLLILCVFSFFWSLLGARLFAVVSDADKSGKFISAAQTVLSLGYMVGPIIAAMMFERLAYHGVLMMAAISFLLCFILVLPLINKLRQADVLHRVNQANG